MFIIILLSATIAYSYRLGSYVDLLAVEAIKL